MTQRIVKTIVLALLCLTVACKEKTNKAVAQKQQVRIASYNIALASALPNDVMDELKSNSQRIKNIANIIQIVNPDILFIEELQYDAKNEHLITLKENYLEVGQNGSNAVNYPYYYHFPTNAGHLSGYDLNKDGDKTGPYDAYGWGTFPDQFALAIFSKYPIDFSSMRTFKNLKWKDLPRAHRPIDHDTNNFYWNDEEWASIYISSKNHVDVPVIVNKDTLHIIGAHTQGAGGDGPELRSTLKNYDEIKLIADYINGTPFQDDKGKTESFNAQNKFVIVGDLNSNPGLTSSINDLAIEQLLNHPYINKEATWGKHVPSSTGALEIVDPVIKNPFVNKAHSTAPVNFGLKGVRIDYVLPSQNLDIINSGVFWPASNEKNYHLVESKEMGSDHRLVFVDIEI